MNWLGFFDHIRIFFQQDLAIYTWRDCVEILTIAAIISFFTRWLNSDQSKKPILLFYAYCGATIICYYFHLTIAGTLLLVCMPILVVALIIVHQHSVQKNFIVPRVIDAAAPTPLAWADELIRAALTMLNKKQSVTYLIERHDQIGELLTAPYHINAPVQKNILELLIEHAPEPETMIWINQQGKIIAAQAHVTVELGTDWLGEDTRNLPVWKQDALFLTHKSDALVVHFDPTTQRAECIAQGKIVPDLTAQHALLLIKRHLTQQSSEELEYGKTKNSERSLAH